MAKFDKLAVLQKIGSTGMVPVFYHKDLDVCKNVVKACLAAGTYFSNTSLVISFSISIVVAVIG